MAEHERADEQAADEKAAVEQDRRTLKQAKRKVPGASMRIPVRARSPSGSTT